MTVNNPDFDQIWPDVESHLFKVNQEIQSEARSDIEKQVVDVIAETQQKTLWIKRLHVGSQTHINVAGEWFVGNVQHACSQAVVLLTDAAITVANTEAVVSLRDLETNISMRGHSEYRCWNSVLRQVHDVKANYHGQFVAGSIELVNSDAFDLRTATDRLTLVWKHISYVHISL